AAGQLVPLLDHLAGVQQVVGPDAEGDPEPAEGDEEQDPLDLGLAAGEVDDEQPDPGQDGHGQGDGGLAFGPALATSERRAPVRLAVDAPPPAPLLVAAGHPVSAPPGDPAGGHDQEPQPDHPGHEPLGHWPLAADGGATLVVGPGAQALDVGGDVVDLLLAGGGAELVVGQAAADRHLPRGDLDRLSGAP